MLIGAKPSNSEHAPRRNKDKPRAAVAAAPHPAFSVRSPDARQHRGGAKLPTKDEARRIAANVAKLPDCSRHLRPRKLHY
jgi:hypothetical protein